MKKFVLTFSEARGFFEPVSLEYDGQMLPVKDLQIEWAPGALGYMTVKIGMQHVKVILEESANAIQTESAG